MPYAEVDGASLWYEDTGGSGTPLVLVHANIGNSEGWYQQVPAFEAAGYRVVRYDLRSHGRSRAPGRETQGTIAGDLDALATLLGLGRFCLVGTAYGAFGAIEFGLDHPERLRALVISTSFGGLSDPEFTAIRSQHIRPDLAQLPEEERELGPTYRAANPEGVKRFLEINEKNPHYPSHRQQLGQPTTLTRLESMRVPAMVIAADEDLYAPPPVMRLFADHIPGARFEVIGGSGHSAYWEQPEAWNRLVLDFLRDK
jgi:pimeloyl-ACP methyl ester carboxylesterase